MTAWNEADLSPYKLGSHSGSAEENLPTKAGIMTDTGSIPG